MNGSFDPQTLRLLDETNEVQIETRRNAGSPAHRTIIWVVVVEGEAFVRSVRATPTTDDRTVDAISDAIRSKYEQAWPGPTAAMVRTETLPTTMKLSPA